MRSPSRGSIGRALGLAHRDRARAVRALAWLIAAGAAVRIVPFATLRRTIAGIPASRSPRAAMTPAQCAEAIRRAVQLYRSARCLPQAIAGYCLLRRGGLTPTLTLGAGFDDGHRFEAHAWLECEGVTVTGGDVAGRYVPLVPAGRAQP